jgi:ketosteroid isomerase-like protein
VQSGDVGAVRDLVAEDVVARWHTGPLDTPAVIRGREAMMDALAQFTDAFDDFHRELDEYVDVGEWVIGVGRWVGTAKISGAQVDVRRVNATRFHDGKVVEWIGGFPDKETALGAVGLSE